MYAAKGHEPISRVVLLDHLDTLWGQYLTKSKREATAENPNPYAAERRLLERIEYWVRYGDDVGHLTDQPTMR